MTKEQVSKLANGLYVITWKQGGASLASVGRLYDGSVWMAPCNWVNDGKLTENHFMAPTGKIWAKVLGAEVIHTEKELRDALQERAAAKKISRG